MSLKSKSNFSRNINWHYAEIQCSQSEISRSGNSGKPRKLDSIDLKRDKPIEAHEEMIKTNGAKGSIEFKRGTQYRL